MDPSAARVVDLFSGAGGMSYGFHAHPSFELVGAVDVEVGKPSTGHGAIDCNATYAKNIGINPLALDLAAIPAEEVADLLLPPGNQQVDVLLACPPCTGFSAVVPKNWAYDDPRNSLVAHVADHVARLKPHILIMENVPQLFRGRFTHHFIALQSNLQEMGYRVCANAYNLTRFGLPQQRNRAIVVAVSPDLPLHTLDDLWEGSAVNRDAVTVRRAIGELPPVRTGEAHPSDPIHSSNLLEGDSLSRLEAIPVNGGSWTDLLGDSETEKYLIPSMRKAVRIGRLNSHRDVYGRMHWDKPAPTIKRECSHVGNGRYSHPEQARQCTARELAILQGFPRDYQFVSESRNKIYRQVGDAVPPMISYQLAHLAKWIISGDRPDLEQVILEGASLLSSDLVFTGQGRLI
jgi:DNA (cytosine-5)-methyltransferase 1